MKYALLSLVLLLSACVSATEMRDAKGKKQIFIECNGTVNSLSNCYKKAAEVCPSGYKTIDKIDVTEGFNAAWGSNGQFSNNSGYFTSSGYASTGNKRNITISCD